MRQATISFGRQHSDSREAIPRTDERAEPVVRPQQLEECLLLAPLTITEATLQAAAIPWLARRSANLVMPSSRQACVTWRPLFWAPGVQSDEG